MLKGPGENTAAAWIKLVFVPSSISSKFEYFGGERFGVYITIKALCKFWEWYLMLLC